MPGFATSTLIELAIDLANSLSSNDRFDRLLSTIRRTIPCDAVVLLSYQGTSLKPLAQQGLCREVLGRRFDISQHPRFEILCRAEQPHRFETGVELPDPYDGLLATQEGDLPVHACMGLPLLADNQLIGLVTLDSMTQNAFEGIPQRILDVIAAMSSATLKTAMVLSKLESAVVQNQKLLQELTTEALTREGGELIGDSNAMQDLKRNITLVAPSDFTVLIEGETGVGKELVARTLHYYSGRSNKPLVYVNCAALPENLIESELFGHVKGAFTGADTYRAGKFSLADGGTLFLDEIGELPMAAQSKLLRVLQNKEIQPVGQDTVEYVDVRIIAATNRNLEQEVTEGHFRSDLYHRLSVYPIQVPNLKEREGDVELLSGYFVENTCRKLGIPQLRINSGAQQLLSQYSWPGNVRELEHTISRATLKARSRQPNRDVVVIDLQDIDLNTVKPMVESTTIETLTQKEQSIPLKQATNKFQYDLIIKVLEASGGNWSESARQLQMDRANLVRLAKRLGIQVVRQVKA